MFDQNKPYVLVYGASIVDITGFCKVNYKTHNSNPGMIKISYGGVCRNIADNMARVGVNTKFISLIGDDEPGKSMIDHAANLGYCMKDSMVLKNSGTPTYMVILNGEGEMVSGLVDMAGIEEADTEFIDSKAAFFENAEYVFVDADAPDILEYMLQRFHTKTKFILDPVSAAKAYNVRHLIKYFHTVKPNIHEAEEFVGFKIKNDDDLREAAARLHKQGVVNVFISLGEDGIFYSAENKQGRIRAKNVKAINVTGAGDSLVAGLGYGYMNGLSIKDTIKYAIAMSVLTVGHPDTINPDMSDEMVQKTIKEIQWDFAEYYVQEGPTE